jgi:hypothetical protein
MNSSADTACRKWPIAALGRDRAAVVTVALALLACLGPGDPASAARRSRPLNLLGDLFNDRPVRLRGSVHSEATAHSVAKVPLPRPRPAEAPAIPSPPPVTAKTAPPESDQPAAPTANATPAPTPQPSACRLALTEEIAIAPSIPDIHGPGGCGGEDLVRLEAIVLADKHRVFLKPAATLRCGMASALADWVRSDVEPLAEGLGSELSDLDNFDSYECRGRNRVSGALLSEHGRANALDVRALKLANGQSIGLTDRNVPRGLRETVLHSVCARFMTVLGPGSDGYHEDHIHLDLMERRNNYKICQWNVWDPMPQIAPLMPAERPAEAPPRQVAGRGDAGRGDEGQHDKGQLDKDQDRKGQDGKEDAKASETPTGSAEPDAAEDDKPDGTGHADSHAKKLQPDKSATKKRRQNRRS